MYVFLFMESGNTNSNSFLVKVILLGTNSVLFKYNTQRQTHYFFIFLTWRMMFAENQ